MADYYISLLFPNSVLADATQQGQFVFLLNALMVLHNLEPSRGLVVKSCAMTLIRARSVALCMLIKVRFSPEYVLTIGK